MSEFNTRLGTTGLISDEEVERNLSEWRRMNVLYECDRINVWYYIHCKSLKINKRSTTYLDSCQFIQDISSLFFHSQLFPRKKSLFNSRMHLNGEVGNKRVK
jgi:hypothetical protein